MVVPNFEVLRERRIVNAREVIRFDIETLSAQLPSTKRILGFDIWQDDLPRTTTRKIKRFEVERRLSAGQAAGHEVRHEHDGVSALVAAAQFQPDVVLLDLGLPGMDGLEVARRLRSHPQLASVRIVALTGFAQGADRSRSAAAGIESHLVKPVDMNTLMDAIGALTKSRPSA